MANRRSQIAGIPRAPQAGPRRRLTRSIIPLFHHSIVPSTGPAGREPRGCRAKQSQFGAPAGESRRAAVQNKANSPRGE